MGGCRTLAANFVGALAGVTAAALGAIIFVSPSGGISPWFAVPKYCDSFAPSAVDAYWMARAFVWKSPIGNLRGDNN